MENFGILAIFSMLMLCSCVGKNQDSAYEQDLKAIHELHETDKTASLNSDTHTLLSLFTEDGIVIPAQGDIIQGKAGLKKMLEENLKQMEGFQIIDYQHDFQEIQIMGEVAYEWGFYSGTYRSKTDGLEISGSGKLMRILKKQANGSWKVARSIWTVDKENK